MSKALIPRLVSPRARQFAREIALATIITVVALLAVVYARDSREITVAQPPQVVPASLAR